jgi:hypothetical protein
VFIAQPQVKHCSLHNYIADSSPVTHSVLNDGNCHASCRTVRYTDIPKISVLNQYQYIDTGYSTIPIYRNFRYTGIFRYIVLNLPTIWRNHNLYFMVGILLQNSTMYICIQLQPRIIIFNNNNYIHIQQ